MNGTLEPLHSILDIPEGEASPIQLFHLSYCDFLFDKERCPDARFWMDEKVVYGDLFVRCLSLMSEHLRKYICNLRLPGALAIEVDTSKLRNIFLWLFSMRIAIGLAIFNTAILNSATIGRFTDSSKNTFFIGLRPSVLLGRFLRVFLWWQIYLIIYLPLR